MALTLAESAKYSQNDLQRGVIETFVIEANVLDRLPLLPIQGNAYAYNEELTLPGIEFRAVNSAYAESTGTINQKTESLVILGGDADVDTFMVKTRGNLNDLRAAATRGKVKAANFKFQDAFINGDVAVDANSFDGLKKRLTGRPGHRRRRERARRSGRRRCRAPRLPRPARRPPGPRPERRRAVHERADPGQGQGLRPAADDLRPDGRYVRPQDRHLPGCRPDRHRQQGRRHADHPADRDPGHRGRASPARSMPSALAATKAIGR